MSATTTTIMQSHGDIEQGILPCRCSAATSDSGDDSHRGSTSSEDEEVAEVGPHDKEGTRKSSSSTCSSSSSSSCTTATCLSECSGEEEQQEVVDLERVVVVEETSSKVSVHLSKVEKDCRICHLSLDGSNPDSGLPIELGCSCKDDLSVAHKQCAEAWFKIRGNKICEICGSTAKNVIGVNEVELMEQWNADNDTATATAPPHHPPETRHFWQGHRFLNFLLACMVFAFVISWLFHFNVPS